MQPGQVLRTLIRVVIERRYLRAVVQAIGPKRTAVWPDDGERVIADAPALLRRERDGDAYELMMAGSVGGKNNTVMVRRNVLR